MSVLQYLYTSVDMIQCAIAAAAIMGMGYLVLQHENMKGYPSVAATTVTVPFGSRQQRWSSLLLDAASPVFCLFELE